MSSRAAGFTLLEALIAIVVVMIGLLGVAHLMLNSISGTQLAMRYTSAAALAGEIVDKARANPAALAGYSVDYGVSGTDNGCGIDTVCSPAEQAEHDLFVWKSQLASVDDGGLPLGDGAVEVAVDDGVTVLTVTVRWDDKGEQLSYRLVAWI